MSFSLPKLSISVASLLISTVAGYSATLHPTNVQVSVPAGSNDTTSPYQDDVLLKELTFGGTVFSSTDQIVSVADFEVLTGRSYINAEWGDLDTNSDGDSDPFTKAGYAGEAQETVDPTIQDTTLKQAFSSFSLSEMSDGEGSGEFSFRMTFTQSLIDNSFGLDDKPELVIFERGMNDNFDIRLILGNTGGTADYSNWIETSSRDFFDTGVKVDTVEISGAQSIGVGGYDFDQFGLDQGQRVFGMELRTRDRSGPDLNGFFLTAEDPDDFGPGLAPVPVPAAFWMLLVVSGGLFLKRRS